MTQYYVDISHELLDIWSVEGEPEIEGWRLVRGTDHDGPWGERWLVEDDGAPEYMRHKLVALAMCQHEDGRIEVQAREVLDADPS